MWCVAWLMSEKKYKIYHHDMIEEEVYGNSEIEAGDVTDHLVGKSRNMSRKLMKFLILFDNSNLLFFPGQFLSGRVILEVDDDMPVLGKLLFFISSTSLITQ